MSAARVKATPEPKPAPLLCCRCSEAIKRVMGWEEIVLSRPFPSDEGKGYAVACYPTQDALDADDTAAHVPWIVEA